MTYKVNEKQLDKELMNWKLVLKNYPECSAERKKGELNALNQSPRRRELS